MLPRVQVHDEPLPAPEQGDLLRFRELTLAFPQLPLDLSAHGDLTGQPFVRPGERRGPFANSGLVVAIDRKDRYTKLHSEDVAAYALFLADRLGLADDERASLRIAALLHDVGKIGIPDDVLRKPGRLTPYEFEIVKQHVALGDLIVRDVPDVAHIREGVRYHHERWDGNGYMLGLAGENIPLIARILAVADAFSAMTTSRPYRKAVATERALDELRAVAGTQLDASLVEAFVSGLELDADAPLPGVARNSKLLWTPTTRAA